ncbi:hypothetical protein IFM89_027915, partial [Coptis chinensis]
MKIWLSLRLGLLNKSLTLDAVQEGMVLTAYVKSIEDHGYILQFGLSSFSGFLPRRNKDGCEMKVNAGQLLQGVVRNIDNTRRVVHMNSDPDIVSKCVTKDIKGISIDLLVPGMMVNARVQSTLENGIMLSFLTYFTGTVDIFHLENVCPSTAWKEEYNQHKKMNARILFIDPSTRAVGLTMNPHLVHNKAPPSRFDVSDKEIKKLEKKFKEGNHVRVRIVGFRHLEGQAMGIMKVVNGTLFFVIVPIYLLYCFS